MTVPELLAQRAATQPDRVAVEVYGAGSLTFAEWHARASAVACGLTARGIRRSQRVGLRFGAQHWIDFAVAYCAVLRAGAVAVPFSDRLAPAQVRHLLAHSGASAVLHEHTAAAPPPPDGGWTASVQELARTGEGANPVAVPLDPADLAQILYTSGTTGHPKGVAATHANLTIGAPTNPRRRTLAHSDHFLHAFPVGTNAGQTMLLNALYAKPSALTLPQFTPARFARLIDAYRVGSVFVVPAMAIELLRGGVLSGRDLSCVRLVGSTAAPLAPAVATELATAFPAAAIVNYYSSTEAAPAQTAMIFDRARPAALGQATGGTLMITDPEGRPLPAGCVGEVWLRSPHPRAYYRDERADRDTFRDGWTRMGDLGRLDADGYLYLVDRDADVIKSGAFKVSTVEVEAAIHEHPDIAQAAVLGVSHEVLGTSVAAAVVLRPGRSGPTLAELRAFLQDRVAGHELPAQLRVLDELPRNEAGKVLKRDLAAYFAPG